MNVSEVDLKKILTSQELKFYCDAHIPYNDTSGLWMSIISIQQKISDAIASGKIKPIYREPVQTAHGPHIITDYIAGPGGALMNHADGKMYDSKSQYHRAVKAAGCVVLGNDAPIKASEPDYKICDKELKRDIAQAFEQLGG